jgi:ATP-binding cassette subfamily B protein
VTSVGVFATLISATAQLSNNLRTLAALIPGLAYAVQITENIRLFFGFESTIEPSTGTDIADGKLSVELRGASFTYPNSEFSLKNINLTIKQGEKIAIVGENGAGKSTLMKLLLRLYDLSEGNILYNGERIRDLDVHKLRKHVGIAFQTPNIYALTLAENMQLYYSANTPKLQEILLQVGLSRLIDELDKPVTKEFDETGIMLSGGEAQKLGLARLLTGDFGLLLLDEPSSALDPIAEYELTNLLFTQANAATTIMVAHRLSTIRNADRIYLIDNGEVTEQGTHAELMAQNGKYCEMFTKQAENYAM